MIDTEKKLTVSFGNFSCTLSGFDDPFPVMRTVVDYFHELSQRDPSFGSKSEHVDTEMLRALAEKSGSASIEAHVDGAEIEISPIDQRETSEELTALLAASAKETPIFDVDDTFVDIAAEDIDFAIGSRHAKSDDIQETVSARSDEPARDVQAETVTLADASIEDASDDQTEASDNSSEELPKWASELISDEPLETNDFPETPEIEDAQPTVYEDVEQAKLDSEETNEIVENADSEISAVDPEHPLSDLKDDFLSAQDEIVQEEAQVESDDFEPHDATQKFEEDDLNRQTTPLRLGFGDTGGLDATKDVESATLDVRSTPDASTVLEQIGLYSGDAENEHFNWDDIREAVPSAFEPKGSEPVETQEAVNDTPAATPPQFQNKILDENVETFSSAGRDISASDPRKDLRTFANSTGAASLPELVEASAAFITLVDGRPSFSRGEILGLVDEFGENDSYSQKARIKSFGKLVRSGRIKRTENGDYTIAGSARSEYESRIAI